MVSLFVSSSSRDRAVARMVGERLRAEGFGSLFLDFDPAEGIPAGRDWERELYAQLRRADGLVFLASAASVTSRWCFAELVLARALGKPVFPLRLSGVDGGGAPLTLLDDVQMVDLADGEAAFTRLRAGLRRAGLDPTDSFGWDPTRPPYPGLTAFAPEDAAVFFGRDDKIDELLHRLDPILPRAAHRLVAIVGPSGSGKSSLLHAGLLPRLSRAPDRWLLLPPLRPGSRPTKSLAASFAHAFDSKRSPAEVARRLAEGAPALVELVDELSRAATGNPRVLVAIDQAEELLTRASEQDQQAFLRLLRGALGEDSPLWVVVTLRSEFLGTAPERAGLTEAADAVVVEPLTRARLPEVIRRPAQRGGLDFDPGLVERMVEDTIGGDALPLLAYTLRELYERADGAGTIRFADYDAVGGVAGALQRRADRVLAELAGQGRDMLVLPTLLKLATIDESGQPTRRRVRRTTFSGDDQMVVDAFIEARLLTSNTDPDDEPTVEVTHEALLRQWRPLREAIEGSRRSLQMRGELERLADDWQQARRRRDSQDPYLLTGERLAAFDDWTRRHAGELTSTERDFVGASRRRRRRIRRLRVVVGALAVLLVLVAATVVAAQTARRVATERASSSRFLLAKAAAVRDSQPDAALLLQLAALRQAPGATQQEARFALRDALTAPYHVATPLTGHAGWVNAVAFSRDGKTVASGSEDNTVRLWDLTGPVPSSRVLSGHRGAVNGVAFSPDGTTLASAGADGTVRLWDLTAPVPSSRVLSGHRGAVFGVAFGRDRAMLASASEDQTVRLWDLTGSPPRSRVLAGAQGQFAVAFSPDGRTLVSGGADFNVRLWDVATGRLRRSLVGHRDYVTGVAFSPDGRTLASGSADRTVQLWDTATLSPRGRPLAGHTGRVNGVAFSPDGKTVASASHDMTVRLWQAAATYPVGRPLRGLDGTVFAVAPVGPRGGTLASASAHSVRLWSVSTGRPRGVLVCDGEQTAVAVSPDGTLLASAGADHTIRLRDIATGRQRGRPLSGHRDVVWRVTFSPDGRTLASASFDKDVRLWDVATGRQRGRPLRGHINYVAGLAFSPDGKTLASAGGDWTVRLWDVATGRPRALLTGHYGPVPAVAFTPDGRTLASASHDQTVRLWDVATGQPRGQTVTGHTARVTTVAFSPDGRILATAGDDRTVRLFDAGTGQPLGRPLIGHTDSVTALAFTPDGRTLASASKDKTVRLWDLSPGSWVDEACRIANRSLSRSEWADLVGPGIAYVPTCRNTGGG